MLTSPLSGKIVALEQVPDPVFAQKMTGDGIAVKPSQGVVLAPFDGKVVHLFESKHAIILEHTSQLQVLIHIGLDTVNMQGDGFLAHVKVGDTVKKGDKLIEFDLLRIEEAGHPTISPVIITNGEIVSEQKNIRQGSVRAGVDDILSIHLKQEDCYE
jgi:glucose-specific phosphotransferase system IIA component